MNGKQIRNFSVDNARMYVSDIKETSDDKLWVIANEYLYCFDRRKEKFVLPSFQDGKKGHFCKCYGNNGGFTFLDSKRRTIAMLETTL